MISRVPQWLIVIIGLLGPALIGVWSFFKIPIYANPLLIDVSIKVWHWSVFAFLAYTFIASADRRVRSLAAMLGLFQLFFVSDHGFFVLIWMVDKFSMLHKA